MLPLATYTDHQPRPASAVRRKRANRYHHGQLREALVALGRREVTQNGWHDLSLRALARRLSVSHTAVYRHYADREALLAALAASAMEDFASALEAAERAGASREAAPLETLAAMNAAYVQFALTRPNEFRLMFSRHAVPASRLPALRAANDRASAPVLRQVTRFLVDSSARSGAPAMSSATELALQLWALVHGVALLLLESQLEEGALMLAGAERESAALVLVVRGTARLLGAT